MEPWIIYAVATSILVGFYWFAQKMKVEMQNQSDNGFVLYSYFMMWVCWYIGMVYSGASFNFHSETFWYAFIITFLYIIIVKSRLKSLKYLSSSTYFINYRIFSSMWLLATGILFFSEAISIEEIVWIFIGFIVFYLLIEKKSEWESFDDMKKGFIYLLIGTVAITWVQSVNKDFVTSGFNIFLLALYQWILGVIFVILLKWKESYRSVLEINWRKHFFFLLLSWTFFWIAVVTNSLAYVGGDLAIVYKIISYSLFIPIILSIIVYKEQVTGKKLFAFVLTILSIFLFI